MPHGVVSILGRILAQRRKCDAVVQSQTTKFERFEELRNTLGIFCNESSARWWILGGSEVGDARRRLVDVVRLLFDVRLDSVVGRRHFGRWF